MKTIDPSSFLKATWQSSDQACDIIIKQITSFAKELHYKINRRQKWILRHEVAAFVANFNVYAFKVIMPDNDDLYDKAYTQYMQHAINYGREMSRPFFSNLPTSFDFIRQRTLDYCDAIFSENYISQHLLTFLSDNEAKRLADFVLNQSQALFSECVSRLIVCQKNNPVSYQNEIECVSLSGLFHASQISMVAFMVHSVSNDFLSSVLDIYFPDISEQEMLYSTPRFIES